MSQHQHFPDYSIRKLSNLFIHEYLREHEKSEKKWRENKGLYLQNSINLSC